MRAGLAPSTGIVLVELFHLICDRKSVWNQDVERTVIVL